MKKIIARFLKWMLTFLETTTVSESLQETISMEEIESKCELHKSNDPFPEIAPSLLNSADIKNYVEKTGMIFPFYKENLKPASYGVKLKGEYVYWQNSEKNEGLLEELTETDADGDKVFVLKRNSIAFVGLEPEFRFPDYIAARFNLKIRHIYQGLLLGTGPLVDPGFKGKIYAPLHNLTNNDYKIKIEKPLIWMEFTKLSTNKLWDNNFTPNPEMTSEYVPFDLEKLKSKKYLKDYLIEAFNGPIKSTIQGFQEEIKENLTKTKEINDSAAKATAQFNRAIIISMLAIVVTIIFTIFQTITVHTKSMEYIREYDNKINTGLDRYLNSEFKNLELENKINELKKEIDTLKLR